MKPMLAAAFALAGLAPAVAGPDQPFTYELFEATVVHMDLDDCPPEMATEETFCRLVAANDDLVVFQFSFDGDLPLVAVRHFPAAGVADLLQDGR